MFGPWLVAWKMKRVGMLGKVAVSQVNSNILNRSGLRSTATAGIKICSTATGLGTVQQQSQVKAKVNSNSNIEAKVNNNGQVKGMSTATVRLKLCRTVFLNQSSTKQ